jgi:hypothetical protein
MADKDMVTALKHVKQFAQICDRKGQIIGIFTPQPLRLNDQPKLPFDVDLEEIERRKRSKEKGESLKVIMGRLRLLEKEIERRKKAGERKLTGDEAVAFVQRLRNQSHAKKHRPYRSVRKR